MPVLLSSRVGVNFGKVAIQVRHWWLFGGTERSAVEDAKEQGEVAHVAAVNVGVARKIIFVPTRPLAHLVERCDCRGFRRLRRVTGRLGAIIAGRDGRVSASQARRPRDRRSEQWADVAAAIAIVVLAQCTGSHVRGNDIGTSRHAAFAWHVRHLAAVYGSRCRRGRGCYRWGLCRG